MTNLLHTEKSKINPKLALTCLDSTTCSPVWVDCGRHGPPQSCASVQFSSAASTTSLLFRCVSEAWRKARPFCRTAARHTSWKTRSFASSPWVDWCCTWFICLKFGPIFLINFLHERQFWDTFLTFYHSAPAWSSRSGSAQCRRDVPFCDTAAKALVFHIEISGSILSSS